MNGILIQGLSKEKSCEECYENTQCFGTGTVDREGCIWCGLSKGYVGTNNLYDRCVVKDIKDCDGIINSSKLIDADHLKETIDYYIREAGWDVQTNRVLGWVKDEFIDSEPVIYSGENKLVCQFDGNELKQDCVANIHGKPRLMEDECVCKNCGLEKGDTLYISSDWDGGIGFDYIHNIKFCPVCGKELSEWRR